MTPECVFLSYSVGLYRRILLTTEPIWFCFTMKLLLGPGKVFVYFWKGTYNLPREIVKRIFIVKLKLKMGQLLLRPLPSTLHAP